MANLWRLETFIVKVSNGALINLPESLLGLAYLKDVCVNNATFSLPGGTFQPENSFESSGIESLSTVTLCHGNDTTDKLIRRLRNLCKLKCVFLISAEDRFPVIDMFSKLESLNVTYHDRRIPLPPLGEFILPSTLKELTLSRFTFPWPKIREIGRRLPKLEVLKLLDKASSGAIWIVTNEGFLNLKFLRLESLDIMEWYASLSAFPCLQQLVIQRCRYLKTLPSIFGESTSLKMIKVEQCDEQRVAKAAQKFREKRQCLIPNRLKLLIQEGERYEPMNWFLNSKSHSVPDSNSNSDADFDSNA